MSRLLLPAGHGRLPLASGSCRDLTAVRACDWDGNHVLSEIGLARKVQVLTAGLGRFANPRTPEV